MLYELLWWWLDPGFFLTSLRRWELPLNWEEGES
jgi:hypothetical protein